MCEGWPCCRRWFNVARIDPSTGRMLWMELVRAPEPDTAFGWEACGIVALPGTDDVAVMVYRFDPLSFETGLDGLESSMRVSRVNDQGRILWETDPRVRVFGVTGFGENPLVIAADEHRVFVGEPPGGDSLPPILTDHLLVFDHEGVRIDFPASIAHGEEFRTGVIADGNEGCLVIRDFGSTHFDSSAAVLWHTSTNPIARTPDDHFLCLDGSLGSLHGLVLDRDDGSTLVDFEMGLETGEDVICAAFLDGLLWIGTPINIVRYRVNDWTLLDRVDTASRRIRHLCGDPQQHAMLATTRGFAGYQDDAVLCFDTSGSIRWDESWALRGDVHPDVNLVTGEHLAFESIGNVAVTDGGHVYVCGNTACR